MVTKILYFASLRESVGQDGEAIVLPDGIDTVGKLRAHLSERGAGWLALSAGKSVRAAVNQRMAQVDNPVGDGDEVAFFPPVTGG